MNTILIEARNLRKKQRELEAESRNLWKLRGTEHNSSLCRVETELYEVKKKLEELVEKLLEEDAR